MTTDGLDAADIAAVTWQLGRAPRGVLRVAHRCPCGDPDVVVTAPRLPDGTPFPTLYYFSCPKGAAAIGTVEGSGRMRALEARLAEDPELAAGYGAAHEAYLAERTALDAVPELEGVSAGGMPARVKCLHVLVAHALAGGAGANPVGDLVLAELPQWWGRGGCAAERA